MLPTSLTADGISRWCPLGGIDDPRKVGLIAPPGKAVATFPMPLDGAILDSSAPQEGLTPLIFPAVNFLYPLLAKTQPSQTPAS